MVPGLQAAPGTRPYVHGTPLRAVSLANHCADIPTPFAGSLTHPLVHVSRAVQTTEKFAFGAQLQATSFTRYLFPANIKSIASFSPRTRNGLQRGHPTRQFKSGTSK